MKAQRIIMFILSVCALWALVGAVANAEPGTETDPLVSKSYVDRRITEVMRTIDNSANTETTPPVAEPEPTTGGQGAVFTPVLVEAGKTIYCGEGCELIMRSGSGNIVTETDGVINATSGADLKNGAKAPLNSLLIVPRNDGRGVKTSDDSWFIVKGGYVIR